MYARSTLSLVGLLILVLPASGYAEPWKVTLKQVTVTQTKETGHPWDADGSAPDVAGWFGAGRLDAQSGECKTVHTFDIAKRQDTFTLRPNLSVIVEADDQASLCILTKFWDVDWVDDDRIGGGMVAIAENPSPRFGPLTLELAIESAQSAHTEPPARQLPPPHPPRTEPLYLFSVVTARIHGKKPDGLTWDEPSDPEARQAQRNRALLGLGLKLLTGRVLPALLGATNALEHDTSSQTYTARTVSAPDPRVILRWGERLTVKTATELNTFAPRWNTRFLVPADVLRSGNLHIEVVDEDDGGDEAISLEVISATDLRRKIEQSSVVRLRFGSVEELVLQVEPMRETGRAETTEFSIDTTKGWIDTGMDVLGGQELHVIASGKHCLASGQCFGPSGDAETVSYRDPVERSIVAHEGELCAIIGDAVIPIGPGTRIIAPSSGRLILGMHDKATSGSISARVHRYYPVEAISTPSSGESTPQEPQRPPVQSAVSPPMPESQVPSSSSAPSGPSAPPAAW